MHLHVNRSVKRAGEEGKALRASNHVGINFHYVAPRSTTQFHTILITYAGKFLLTTRFAVVE